MYLRRAARTFNKIIPKKLLLSIPVVLIIAGCKSAPPPPPTPTASFSKPLLRHVSDWDIFPGRLQSPDIVNLSARVSGIIEKAPFKEGAIVNAGDVLFIVDERPFRADFQSKEAEVMSAQAALAQSQAHFKRYEALKGTKAIAAEDYDEALAALQQAKSRIAVAEAARAVSKLNLEWTRVVAPISGKISRKFVTEGNLVSGGVAQSTLLTTITSIDPMYCYVNVQERSLLKYSNLSAQLKASNPDNAIPCAVQLENENAFNHKGYINFIESRIDPGTGTVEVRCALENKDGALSSGLFARMQLLGSLSYEATLIPETAIGTDQSSRFILLVNAENTIVRQAVELGNLFGTFRAIKTGLKAEDKVVVTGLQQLRPGTKVNSQEVAYSPEALAKIPDSVDAVAGAASESQSKGTI